MNTSTLTVLERSREIGTFRALGYTRRDVTDLFVREMALLATLGLALGLLLAAAVSIAVAFANIRVTPPGVPGRFACCLRPARVCTGHRRLVVPVVAPRHMGRGRRSARRGTADLLTAMRG